MEVRHDAGLLGPLGRLGDGFVAGHARARACRSRPGPGWPPSGAPGPAAPWRPAPWPGAPSGPSRAPRNMSARAPSRSRSSSAASSAKRVVVHGADAGAPARRGRRQSPPVPPAARRGRARRPSSRPASPAPRGRPGPARAARRRTGRGRRAGAASPPACRAAPRGPRPAGSPAPSSRSTASWRRSTAKASSPMVDSAPILGRTEVGRAGDLLAEGQQARLELGEAGRLEPARDAQLLHDRLQRVEPLGLHLDLDPPQLHRPLAVADDDDGVVERDLGRVDAADAQGEGPAAGAHLEHLAQPVRARRWRAGAGPPGRRGPARRGRTAGRTSVTSRRWRRPLPSAGRVSFSVTSSWRPRRRVRTTKPARAMRQSSVSR